MREWNDIWSDPIDASAPESYRLCLRRCIMAAINYIEAHPRFRPNFRNLHNTISMKAAPDMDPETVIIMSPWDNVYVPNNKPTERWFRAIADAGAMGSIEHEPSAFMFQKALACAYMVRTMGWDKFNTMMATHMDDGDVRH